MTANITLITPPDDVYKDALRVLLVDVTHEQSQLITEALTQIDDSIDTVIYVWTGSQSIEWLVDKKHKSDFIVFNADSQYENIVGYIAAQPNSYYMGVLRNLEIINNRAIKDVEVCANIFENYITNYAKR